MADSIYSPTALDAACAVTSTTCYTTCFTSPILDPTAPNAFVQDIQGPKPSSAIQGVTQEIDGLDRIGFPGENAEIWNMAQTQH